MGFCALLCYHKPWESSLVVSVGWLFVIFRATSRSDLREHLSRRSWISAMLVITIDKIFDIGTPLQSYTAVFRTASSKRSDSVALWSRWFIQCTGTAHIFKVSFQVRRGLRLHPKAHQTVLGRSPRPLTFKRPPGARESMRVCQPLPVHGDSAPYKIVLTERYLSTAMAISEVGSRGRHT